MLKYLRKPITKSQTKISARTTRQRLSSFTRLSRGITSKDIAAQIARIA